MSDCLKNDVLNFQKTTKCTRALEQAHLRAESYASQIGPTAAAPTKYVFANAVTATTITKNMFTDSADPCMECAALSTHDRCYNCGGKCYPKDDGRHCPARDKICRNCGKLGYVA